VVSLGNRDNSTLSQNGTDARRVTIELTDCSWPVSRLGEALVELASASRLVRKSLEGSRPLGNVSEDSETFDSWIGAAAASVGIEAEPAEVNYREVDRWLHRAGPALLRLHQGDSSGFLALLGGSRKAARVLGPDLAVHQISWHRLSSAICRELEAPIRQSVENLLNTAGVTKQKRDRARAVLFREHLGATPIAGIWLLRLGPGASFLAQSRKAGLLRPLARLASLFSVQYLLGIVGWVVVGRAALNGRFDRGWLTGWALLVLTLVPLSALASWYQGLLAIGASGLLKRRLLYGAMRLEPEEVRHLGAGQLLSRVIESEAVELLALSAGFMAVFAPIELAIALPILVLGAGGWFEAVLFIAWIVLTLFITWDYLSKCNNWTVARLGMTHDMVEKMVGHRTRLAQEAEGHWHSDEDQAVKGYLQLSKSMDRGGILLAALMQGWLIVGVLGLAPAFVSGHASRGELAIGLGGILLAAGALGKITSGVSSFGGAAIAWAQVSPLFYAAARPEVIGSPEFASAPMASSREAGNKQTMLEAYDLTFRHRGRSEPVLQGLSLRIRANDRLLLTGASGGGKSTLAAVLAGLRNAESGVILLGGLDRTTLGSEAWRRRIALAPQFHENHVMTETFAFNLLMGKRWPPTQDDLNEAENICRELGLDEVLERMPAGLAQRIGETGWQLSHGERSRLFLARALLQQADLVIFDESFAALDPENLLRALRCATRRAHAMILIAHP
jgi:ATP-binding cassette, subfamily B, bacterial